MIKPETTALIKRIALFLKFSLIFTAIFWVAQIISWLHAHYYYNHFYRTAISIPAAHAPLPQFSNHFSPLFIFLALICALYIAAANHKRPFKQSITLHFFFIISIAYCYILYSQIGLIGIFESGNLYALEPYCTRSPPQFFGHQVGGNLPIIFILILFFSQWLLTLPTTAVIYKIYNQPAYLRQKSRFVYSTLALFFIASLTLVITTREWRSLILPYSGITSAIDNTYFSAALSHQNIDYCQTRAEPWPNGDTIRHIRTDLRTKYTWPLIAEQHRKFWGNSNADEDYSPLFEEERQWRADHPNSYSNYVFVY